VNKFPGLPHGNGDALFAEKWFAVGVDIFYNEASMRRRACDA